MLIYNSKKEFIGIDEKDLKTFGYQTFSSLKAEVSDFADLFVKTPGFIHNFQHVHWIDFITCADSSETPKVIINVNNKNFQSTVHIETLYLSDNPSSKAYIVYLNNIRELGAQESEAISGDVTAHPIPQVSTPLEQEESLLVTPDSIDKFDIPEEPEEIKTSKVVKLEEDSYDTPLDIDLDTEDVQEEVYEEVSPEKVENDFKEDLDEMLDVGDLSFEEEEIQEPVQATHTTTQLVHENFDNGYIYDPQVASDELGLPLDLIEEFIQDFIAQAKEFKEGLYTALENGEHDQVKILSHKLKGVAANLRIEDAFETLSTVNTAEDNYIIRENLDIFYKIIAKLSGEEIVVEKVIVEADEEPEETHELPLENSDIEAPIEDEDDELYGNLLDIEDSEVPQKIEIPELADDDYLASDVDLDTMQDEIDQIEDIDLLELDKPVEQKLIEEPEVSIEYPKAKIAAEIGLDIESFNELVHDYVSESRLSIEKMKSALENDDYLNCQHEALRLKGMSDNMRVKDFTQELETLMHSSDKEEISKAIQKIEMFILKISSIEV